MATVTGYTATGANQKFVQFVPYNAARPVTTAIVVWVGGSAGTPPTNMVTGDLWIHS